MKRVMRRMAGNRVPEAGNLPPRIWEGLPMDQLVVDVQVWPLSEAEKPTVVQEEEADPKGGKKKDDKKKDDKKKSVKKQETETLEEVDTGPKMSPSVHSHRSPLHKHLFKGRNNCYQWYSKQFTDFMAERHKKWHDYENKEKDLVKSWKQNVKQLKVFTDDADSDDEVEEEKVEEAIEEEVPLSKEDKKKKK